MTENEMDHLGNLVEGIKGALNSKDDDYVTVYITVFIGDEAEVVEAEEIIDSINRDDFPCKNAFIKMSDWLGKRRED